MRFGRSVLRFAPSGRVRPLSWLDRGSRSTGSSSLIDSRCSTLIRALTSATPSWSSLEPPAGLSAAPCWPPGPVRRHTRDAVCAAPLTTRRRSSGLDGLEGIPIRRFLHPPLPRGGPALSMLGGRPGLRRPHPDGAHARSRPARRPSRPALPGRLGALRLARGGGGPRPGDVRRVLARPRFLRHEDDLGYLLRTLRNTFLTQRRNESRRLRPGPLPDQLDWSPIRVRATRMPRSRPPRSMRRSPRSRRTSATRSSRSMSPVSRTRRPPAPSAFPRAL